MFVIGNEELDILPPLEDVVVCDICGGTHPVQYGEEVLEDGTKIPSKNLAYIKCAEQLYLVGIDGKDIRAAKG